jgi:peptidoglycan/LPS O-acetylase OafA/YrhL
MLNENKHNERISELDALRGIAAASVMLFHYTLTGVDGIVRGFSFKYGFLGVQLFFMISGFVIFMTIDKTKKSTDFIVSRFSRLFPAYWMAIFLTVSITLLFSSIPFNELFSIKQILINLTMLQYWFKVKDIEAAYWTLAIELTFYLIMLTIFILKKLEHIENICIVWLFMVVVIDTIDMPFKNYINAIFILKHAALFIGGICFFLIKKNGFNKKINIILISSLLVELYTIYIDDTRIIPLLAICLFYSIFYLYIHGKLKFLSNKILIYLGSISYPLYLIHDKIGSILIRLTKHILDNQIVYLPIAIFVILVLSTLINIYFEKPSMKFIRNSYINYKERKLNS